MQFSFEREKRGRGKKANAKCKVKILCTVVEEETTLYCAKVVGSLFPPTLELATIHIELIQREKKQ